MKIKGLNVPNTLTFCVVMCAVLLGVFLFFRAMPLISPLVAAFVISVVLEPLVRQLMKRIKLKRAFAVPAVVILLIAIVLVLLWALTLKLIKEYNSLIVNLPAIIEGAYVNINSLLDQARAVNESLPLDIPVPADIDGLYEVFNAWATKNAQSVAEGFARTALSTASRVPQGIIFVITLVLSTFFMLTERESQIAFFRRNLPQKWLNSLAAFRSTAFSAIFGYIRAQLIIMCILFVMLFIGLWILKVDYAYVIAFLTAFLDALPVFGSSLVLLPWALWCILLGNYFQGVGLVVLFLVCAGLRRFIEPKILSNSIGINALMVVTTMYAGLRLIGVAGLVAGPLVYILLRTFIIGMMHGLTFKEYFLIEDDL